MSIFNLVKNMLDLQKQPLRDVLKKSHTPAWVFSCKSAAYFQNTDS